jgi:hypothetical protein
VFHERLDFSLQEDPRRAGDDEVIRIADQMDLRFIITLAWKILTQWNDGMPLSRMEGEEKRGGHRHGYPLT